MTSETRDKLTKLMQLTLSANDNEALVALRKANELIAREKLNWEGVFAMIASVDVMTLEQYMKKCGDSWESAYGFRPFSFGSTTKVNPPADAPKQRAHPASKPEGKGFNQPPPSRSPFTDGLRQTFFQDGTEPFDD